MLRLVMNARFPAPAYQQQDREPVNVRIAQGQEGIKRVSNTGILHKNKRNFVRGKVVSGGKRYSRAFIYRGNTG
jgi:hypothetical protein